MYDFVLLQLTWKLETESVVVLLVGSVTALP